MHLTYLADLMAKTLKQTDDRVSEVKRRAEEAVTDVKRQAVVELQKAVCAAEEKANEALSQAQARMDKAVEEARRQATEETSCLINKQESSKEVSFSIQLITISTIFIVLIIYLFSMSKKAPVPTAISFFYLVNFVCSKIAAEG